MLSGATGIALVLFLAPAQAAEMTPPKPERTVSPRVTVGIVPLANKTGKSEWDYMGGSIAQIVTTNLSRNRGCRVVVREQLDRVMMEVQLGNSGALEPESAQKLGKLLGAKTIVTGSIILLGGTFRIDANIVEVATGEVLTSETVTGAREADLIPMSDQLSIKILNAILPSVVAADPAPTARDAPNTATRALPASPAAGAPMSPVLKSLLLPGWGQIASGRTGRGAACAALAAGALALNLYEYRVGTNALARVTANNVEGNPERASALNEMRAADRLTNASLAALIVVWAANVAEAALAGNEPPRGRTVRPVPGGAALAWTW